MIKKGIIPPHFLHFIHNEGISAEDFRPGNMTNKDVYDRFIVKFPFSIYYISIQVIFDFFDQTSPPDFILIRDENMIIKYSEIMRDWNFKDSSSLYRVLVNIINEYEKQIEIKF